MKTDRWRQVDGLLQSALDRAPGERAAFLERACAGDPALRREVESLLASADEAGSFIERPAPESGGALLDDAPPALEPGRVLGGYEIVRPLGAGGMGEVYLARHTRHDRPAALKVLPRHFTAEPQRLERFRREARAVLALNHPNVVTAYDIGEPDGVPFIATEFVEGETLRSRLARLGRLEIADALDVAAQVAAALAYAHERGVVHRDVKPENVMLRADGYVKVLDFGIAKMTERRAPGAVTGEDATRLRGTTSPGMVMGTASYMSPEQARGLEVDARTDLWSLGVILYEMLTGRAPFAGETVTDTLALILHRNPPPLAEQLPGAPEEVGRIVAKALEKDREDRYQTAKDMLADLRRFRKRHDQQIELERSGAPGLASGSARAASGGVAAAPTVALSAAAATADAPRHATSAEYVVAQLKSHRRGAALASLVALVVLAGAGFALYRYVSRRPAERPAPVAPLQGMKFTRLPALGGRTIGGALSPDGKFLMRAVEAGGGRSLRLRQLTGTTEREIVSLPDAGILGAVFAPDGGSVYYASKRKGEPVSHIYRAPVLGGDAERVGSDVGGDLTISPDGKRLAFVRYGTGEDSVVVMNAAGGGEETLVTRRSPLAINDVEWSPDGSVIAYSVFGTDAEGYFLGVEAVGVADRATRAVSSARWRSIVGMAWLSDGSGLVLCARDRASLPSTPTQLWFVPYPSGEAFRITNDLNHYEGIFLTADSRTALAGQALRTSQVWIAPGGEAARARQLTTAGVNGEFGVSWTPDGRVVYESDVSGNLEIWSADADGGGARQLTFDQYADTNPVAAPDGSFVVFMTNRSVGWSLWRVNADGGGARELARNVEQYARPHVSPDSRWVYYTTPDGGRPALWKVAAGGGAPLKVSDRGVRPVRVSPDGTRLAGFYRDPAPDSPVKVVILPAEGGEPVLTLDTPAGTSDMTLDWSPGGQGVDLIVTREGASNLWRLPLAGGKPQQLTDWKGEQIYWFAWSRDGRTLAAARGGLDYELVLIENFR